MNMNKEKKVVYPVTTRDFRHIAEKKLPRFLFDYIDGGSSAEITLNANVDDFNHYSLKQRVMCNVENCDTSTTIMGQDIAMPVIGGPIGFAGMMPRRGEVQGARAARKANIPFTLSTVGICPMEELVEAEVPFWFQLYMLRDREVVKTILQRAESSGVTTLVFTVDLPMAGPRMRDYTNGMLGTDMASGLARAKTILGHPGWVWDVGIKGKPLGFGNLKGIVERPDDMELVKEFIESQFDPTVTWDDIAWIREIWKGNLIVKGVMEVEDAQKAVEVGAQGIVVSNHGGRQLDGVASSISKLGPIVEAVGGQTEIIVDGGIRNGTDVVKAIALGANAVMIGRPWIWSVAARGEAGMSTLLKMFQEEISVAMALMGVNSIDEITPKLIESKL